MAQIINYFTTNITNIMYHLLKDMVTSLIWTIFTYWTSNKILKLNDSKTLVLFLGTPIMLANFSKPSVKIGMEYIDHSDSARNIGALCYSTLEMKEQVGQVCKAVWGHIRNIAKIRPCLKTPVEYPHCWETHALFCIHKTGLSL